MKRFDIITGRKSGDRTYWTKIGSAFERDNGGFSLVFDALPIGDADGCRALMVEPKAKDEPRRDPARQAPARDLDDDSSIPF